MVDWKMGRPGRKVKMLRKVLTSTRMVMEKELGYLTPEPPCRSSAQPRL